MDTTSKAAPARVQKAESQGAKNERLVYENEKLKYEVEELKRWRQKLYLGFLSAIVSSVVAVITFLIGQNASKSTDRIHATDVLYQQAVNDVGSSDASVRLSGVTALKRFIVRPPSRSLLNRIFVFSSNEETEDQARRERRRDAEVLIVSRLRNESDLAVIQETLAAIEADEDPPAEDFADLNRIAQESFVNSAARLSAHLLLLEAQVSHLDQCVLCTRQELVRSVYSEMENVILRSPRLSNNLGTPYPAFAIWFYLYSPVVESNFASQQRYFLNSDNQLHQSKTLYRIPDSSMIEADQAGFVQSAIFLEATSIALSEALNRHNNVLPTNVAGVALVTGYLHPVQHLTSGAPGVLLAGVNLSQSYIGIPINGISFSGSDLSNTDLRQMEVGAETTFSGAKLAGAIVKSGEPLKLFLGAGGALASPVSPGAQVRSGTEFTSQMPPFCSDC